MDKVKFHGIAIGGKIYSLRMAKRMTQEQLAAVLNISPAAVSKWERNLSVPGIDMLWALADFFDCSIDELAGRVLSPVERVGMYNEEKLRLAMIGEDLLKCSEISRAQGLLAMEEAIPQLKGESRFLAFAIPYIMYFFMKQYELDTTFLLLQNYINTLPETQQAEGRMVAAVLKLIFAGQNPEFIQETIASHIGIDYREKMGSMGKIPKCARQEIINKYADKKLYSANTGLLEKFSSLGDFEIQVILRNTDTATLTAALTGASGKIVMIFLSNLSDRVLYFISEDLEHWQGTEEEILTAQKKILETGSFISSSRPETESTQTQ